MSAAGLERIEEQARKAALERALLENKERAHAARLVLLHTLYGTSVSADEYKRYQDNPERLRQHLNQEYQVSNNNGVVNMGKLEGHALRVGMVVGVLEFMSNSAVPITAPAGGSPEQHIELLKNLLAIDYSVEQGRLAVMAEGIRQFIEENPGHPDAAHIETLIALSEANARLHSQQKSSAKPLTQAERRNALEASIGTAADAGAKRVLLAECDQNFKAITQSLVRTSAADFSKVASTVDTTPTAEPAKVTATASSVTTIDPPKPALVDPKPAASSSPAAFPRSQSMGDIDALKRGQEKGTIQKSKAAAKVSPSWTVQAKTVTTPTPTLTTTSTNTSTNVDDFSPRKSFGGSS